MPDEVSKKLGEANLMYATRRYKEAMDLLNDVIKDVSHLMKCETLKCETHAAHIDYGCPGLCSRPSSARNLT